MIRERDDWETLALGLAAGLLCQAAPALVAVALAAAVGAAHVRNDAHAASHLASLGLLGAITMAGLIGGPASVIGAALIWRVGDVIWRGRALATFAQLGAAPFAGLAFALDAPDIILWAGVAWACFAWADWCISRLAAWRLGAPLDAAPFFLTQLGVVTPLVVLPAPGAALAALVVMTLARRWRFVPATAAYVAA